MRCVGYQTLLYNMYTIWYAQTWNLEPHWRCHWFSLNRILDPRFGIVTDSQVTGVKMGSQGKIDDVRIIIAGSEPLCHSRPTVLLSLVSLWTIKTAFYNQKEKVIFQNAKYTFMSPTKIAAIIILSMPTHPQSCILLQ